MKYKINDICKVNSENITKNDDYKFINYLDTANITEGKIEEIKKIIIGKDKIPSRAKRKVKENDIIISTVRPNLKHYGIIKKPLENMIVSTGFAVLSPNENIVDPNYLYYYITQQKITDYLTAIAETSTSTYPSITVNVVKNIVIDLPPKSEQSKIAKILSVLDEKIELNNEINLTLEEIAQAIFKHWFIDFEFPNENGEPYKSSGGKLIETELGKMPKTWKVVTINEIANNDIVTGKTPSTKKKEYYGDFMPFVTIPDMHSNVFVVKPERFLSKKGVLSQVSKTLPKFSIMVSCIATPGLVSITGTESQTNQQINSIKCEYNQCFYLYNTMKNLSDHIIQLGSGGSTTLNLNKTEFGKIKILHPENKIMNKFHNTVEPLYLQILNNQKENESLQQIRDTLLPKLMSGEIRVPEAEQEVEACLQKNV